MKTADVGRVAESVAHEFVPFSVFRKPHPGVIIHRRMPRP
jgi:hypothetical protein